MVSRKRTGPVATRTRTYPDPIREQRTTDTDESKALQVRPTRESRKSDKVGNRVTINLTLPTWREILLGPLPFWGVILLAFLLRCWGVGDKPMHHDESLHGYFSMF